MTRFRCGVLAFRGVLLGALILTGGLGATAQDTTTAHAVTVDDLARQALQAGLKGTMHAVRPDLDYFVFTWWDPKCFFDNRNFPAYPANPEVETQLSALKRHQAVVLKGRLVQTAASEPHLLVEAVEPGKRWDPGVAVAGPAEKPLDLKKALSGKKRIRALVHALSEDGGMLVIEYAGDVVPVQVPDDAAIRTEVRSLYRGDRIELRFRKAERPGSPLHLEVAPEGRKGGRSIVVTDAIHDLNGQARTVEGRLVLFPRSPVLRRTIYGVEESGPDGLNRYYTIFNFDDEKDQDVTDARLKSAWESAPAEVLDGRNKYLGANAVSAAADLIGRWERAYRTDEPAHPFLGAPTLNVGPIQGGVKVNVVPDRCTLQLDMRTVPPQVHAELVAELRRHLAAVCVDRPGVSGEVSVFSDRPPISCPSDAELALALRRANRAVTGLDPEPQGVPYCTEACIWVPALGIPAVICGPGSVSQLHQPDEWTPIAELEAAARVYHHAAMELLS